MAECLVLENECIGLLIIKLFDAVDPSIQCTRHPIEFERETWIASKKLGEDGITFRQIQTSPSDMFAISAQSESGELVELTSRTLDKGILESSQRLRAHRTNRIRCVHAGVAKTIWCRSRFCMPLPPCRMRIAVVWYSYVSAKKLTIFLLQ